jgi:NAD(P)-dependent dehydrogenase (short-subunit alcohol dehydrogenase family)
MGFEPEGKVGVVTGSAGGIGLGIVKAFAEAGMRVVMADIDADRLDESADMLGADGHDVTAVPTDVTSFASVTELAEATMDTYGRVDVVCNNAGVGVFNTIAESTLPDWEWTLAIDLWGPIHGVKAFLPLITANKEQSHINSTSSVAGLIAGQTAGAYNVAKHAVVALMATLEREFRSSKSIHRASVLCPGPIRTGIGRNSLRQRKASLSQQESEQLATRNSDSGRKLNDRLSDTLAAAGMDPDEVGHIVLDGIVNDKFWIFTHPKLVRHLREQFDLMESDGLLSRARLF